MAISNKFNPRAQYIVKTTFRHGGIDYLPGQLSPASIQGGRLETLYENGQVWYGWQQKAAIEAAEKKAAAIEARKAKKSKQKSTSEFKSKKTSNNSIDKDS
jgi:hypothetical protein